MSPSTFGAVLAAVVLYGVLQIVVDNGTAAIGARMAARGELGPLEIGQIVRIRLAIAIAVAPIALGFGALGVSGSLQATAPFVAALVLFALLNVWEPYGAGDSRPLAAYLAMRSAVPAAVVAGILIAGLTFPQPLAGLLECGVIVALGVLFGQRPLEQLRLAARARGGPWRPTLSVGVPSVVFQASVAAGTLTLSGFGGRAAAGVFAACVRLLTGLNSVNGVATAALFPRLAQDRAEPSGDLVRTVLRLIVTVSAGATGACVLLRDEIARVLFEHPAPATVTALVLTTGAAAMMSNVQMLSYLLIARRHESEMLAPYALGAAITIGFGVSTVAVAGTHVELVATGLLAGQLAMMLGLVARAARRIPELRTELVRAAALSALVAAAAAASLIQGLATPIGIALVCVAAALGWGLLGSLIAGRRSPA